MRAISAFEAAARHECFAAAAKELNLTQSAISHSIRGLEAQIGAQLFTRRGPHLQLTPQGRVLAERMRAGLQLLAQALQGACGLDAEAGLVVAASGALPQRALMARAAVLQGRRRRSRSPCGSISTSGRCSRGRRTSAWCKVRPRGPG